MILSGFTLSVLLVRDLKVTHWTTSTYIYDGSIRRDLPLWMVLFDFLSFPHHQGALVLP